MEKVVGMSCFHLLPSVLDTYEGSLTSSQVHGMNMPEKTPVLPLLKNSSLASQYFWVSEIQLHLRCL